MAKPDTLWIRVKRDRDYDHPALWGTTLAFLEGQEREVSTSIAEDLIANGDAEKIAPPKGAAEAGDDDER